MKTIIAADIHGVSAQLRSMLAFLGAEAIFLSPWPTEVCRFASEQEAVSEFLAQQGLDAYAEKISVAANNEPLFLVAFSVGATAAWIYSAGDHCNPLSVTTLFYGSRIRDYASLAPRCNVTAVFAAQEPSFAPATLAQAIAGANVHAVVEPGTLHGFMNPCSTNYAPSTCATHLQKIAQAIKMHRQYLAAGQSISKENPHD